MKLTTAFYSICIFLCAQFSETKAQNTLQRFFEVADSLLAQAQFTNAAIAYERCVFACQDTGTVLQKQALIKKSFALKAAGNFSQALATLYRIPLSDMPDSLRIAIGYEIVLNAYLSGQYADAQSQLEQLAFYTADTVLLNQTLFLKVLVLNELQKWDEAKVCFRQYLALNKLPPSLAEEYYGFMLHPRLKNPEKARRISTFMPGVGQLYGGNTAAGLISLGLQLGLLGFGVYEIWQGYYLTGFGTGLALFQAFYFGGIENAEAVTKKKNKQKVSSYNNRVKDFILSVEHAR